MAASMSLRWVSALRSAWVRRSAVGRRGRLARGGLKSANMASSVTWLSPFQLRDPGELVAVPTWEVSRLCEQALGAERGAFLSRFNRFSRGGILHTGHPACKFPRVRLRIGAMAAAQRDRLLRGKVS